jgi:tetratricopeptide (TPR) repeat protein
VGFATGAEVASIVLKRGVQLDQGFDHYRDTEGGDVVLETVPGPEKPIVFHTRPARDITHRGIEFLRAHRDEPFFLWLHYYDPHAPYIPPEPYRSRFSASAYHGEVAFVDAQLERFFSTLASLGLKDQTLVVLTSDHGEALGEHGEETHLYFVYESTMRVPCLVSASDLPGGRRIAEPVRTIDLAPTVLDWLGVPALQEAQGVSLLPLLQDTSQPLDRLVYGESVGLQAMFGAPVLRFVREGQWKYIHKVRPALYDLAHDPTELRNLAPEQPARVAALRERMRELLADAPRVTEEASRPLDSETAAQLVQLGYVIGAATPASESELSTFEVAGMDADDLIADTKLFSDAGALLASGQAAEGLRIYSDLAKRYPKRSPIQEGLISSLLALNHREEALVELRSAVEFDPYRRPFHDGIFKLLRAKGDEAGLLQALRATVSIWPCDVELTIRLARLAGTQEGHRAGLEALEAWPSDCSESGELNNELAWLLATAPEAALRDGARAQRLAEQALKEMADDNPLVMDTLAAAHAEQGNWAEAARILERAVALTRQQHLPRLVLDTLSGHLALILKHEPIRE